MAEETIGEIVQDIRAAVQRMGVNNPHRQLLMRCGNSLISMARRLAEQPLPETEVTRVEVVQ